MCNIIQKKRRKENNTYGRRIKILCRRKCYRFDDFGNEYDRYYITNVTPYGVVIETYSPYDD